ncbi:MAG: 4Fe-4S binding protein [Candidatus Thermoplasmatota archaeon]
MSYPKKGAMGKTGSWRIFKPKLDKDKCVKCLRCWIFCPEAAIERKEDGTVEIDFDYCKGCGVCANVCKVKAIDMKREDRNL